MKIAARFLPARRSVSAVGLLITCYLSLVTTIHAQSPATLNVTSSPDVGIPIAGEPSATSGTTPYPITQNTEINTALTPPQTWNGESFLSWTGCPLVNGIFCQVRVQPGESKTVIANYSGSAPQPSPQLPQPSPQPPQPSPPPRDPNACKDALYTDKLTKIVLEPQIQQLSATDLPGNPGEIQHTFTFQVDFSQLSAIFAQPNSDYPEGRFQDASHRQTDILSLVGRPSFNLFHGPGQKAAARVMVDQLKQKYVKYISEKPMLAESDNLYSDINGQDPKTILDLVSAFGEPNPPSLGGNDEVWLSTWGRYWEKIPTAVSEFYYGVFTYAVIEGEQGLELLEEQGECPGNERRVFFVLPEYFRTASIVNQLNNLLVPNAAQSSEEKFVDNNLLAHTPEDTKNALAKIIEACLKPFKNLSFVNPLKKLISLNFPPIIKEAYAAAIAPNPFTLPPVEKCPKPIAPLPNDKEGTGPFCSVPEIIGGKFNLNEGECQNVESPNKLDDGTNVKCTFQRNYQRAPLIGTEEDPGVWDSCSPVNNGSGQYTCTITVRVYPIFYIPWLAPIWNNTTYSDQNDEESIFGDGKTGKDQETGRPGIYTLFKPKSVDFVVFPEGKNLPSEEQNGAQKVRQRFLGAVECNKDFIRDIALKPKALQDHLGITNKCNLQAQSQTPNNTPSSNVPSSVGSSQLDYYIRFADTSIQVTSPDAIKTIANSSWPGNNINRACPGSITCWDYVINQSIARGISPAFSIAIWWEEGGFGGAGAGSEFGCFPGGNTSLQVSFQDSLNCFLNFTANEHPYNSSSPQASFTEWVRYFCGPGALPICSNNPGFIDRLESVYNTVAPGKIVYVDNI